MSSAMPKRGWGFACTVCRRRKAKCDGQKPCMLCQRAGEECVYRDGASVSTLHRELERANNRIRQLEARLAGPDRAREASQDVTSRGQDTPQGEDQEILADHGVDEAGNVSHTFLCLPGLTEVGPVLWRDIPLPCRLWSSRNVDRATETPR